MVGRSQFIDEDGDVAHEFYYEERGKMLRRTAGLQHQVGGFVYTAGALHTYNYTETKS